MRLCQIENQLKILNKRNHFHKDCDIEYCPWVLDSEFRTFAPPI